MRRLTPTRCLLLLGAALGLPLFSQVRLTLEQAGSRNRPDYTPVYEGKEASVRGQVSTKPVWSLDSYYLPIQDEAEYGLLLEGSAPQLNGLEPGDWVNASGRVVRHAGLPVLIVREVQLLAHGPPPAAKELRLEQLNSFRYLGVLVTTQGRLNSAGETSGGDIVSLAQRGVRIDVFLPKMRRNAAPGLQGYRPGDVVRATGIATQYCTLAPYDRSYQVLLGNPGGLVLVDKAWIIPPSLLLTALIVILALLALWSLREHHMAALRRRSRVLNSLGEEVIGSSTPSEVVRKLIVVLSKLMHLSGVGIFVCNRQLQTLDSFCGEGSAQDYVDLQPQGGPILEAASTALRNRTLLAIPDTRRSPLFHGPKGGHVPRSALFVPMFAQTELVGILEVEYFEGVRYFTREEQASLQHLANQAAAALKLQEQQSIREQLFRTEKLAAAGQLMSGIANELRLPLEAIVNLTTALRARDADDPCGRSLAVEARRASEIVHRLLSFSGPDTNEVEPVDVNEMLGEVADLQETALRARNISIRRRLAKESMVALGSREQLAQVILNLLIYAEQLLGDVRGPSEVRITSGLLARRALIEIAWPARISEADAERNAAELIEKTGLSLEVCRGIIHSHGGELRVSQTGSDVRFEVDLPLIEAKAKLEEGSGERTVRRQLTVLVVEPEAASQGHVVGVFASLGHRVVPVASAEEGADLAQRMRFDIAVCALRLTGLSWADFLERVRGMVGGVILLTDAYDPNLTRTFKSSDVFVLTKPADPADIKHICATIEECGDRAPTSH